MWTRSELKREARLHLKGKYWMAFAVAIISVLIGGGSQMGVSYSFDSSDISGRDWYSFQSAVERFAERAQRFLEHPFAFFAILMAVLGTLFGILFFVFVSTVVEAGANRWFSRSREMGVAPSISLMFSLFKQGAYLPTVAAQFWKNLFLFLWGLLPLITIVISAVIALAAFVSTRLPDFNLPLPQSRVFLIGGAMLALVLGLGSILLSIPVINRSYAYRMTPWILGDNPQIGRRRALRLSIAMTRGHKFEMFVLDLSFIGWFFLGVLACGVGILFVIPYYHAVQAELYAKLRDLSVDAGLSSMEEYGFVRVDT